MRIYEATIRATGRRYFYSTRRIFGRVQYTAEVAEPSTYRPAWCATLTEARKIAEQRGTLAIVGAPPRVRVVGG